MDSRPTSSNVITQKYEKGNPNIFAIQEATEENEEMTPIDRDIDTKEEHSKVVRVSLEAALEDNVETPSKREVTKNHRAIPIEDILTSHGERHPTEGTPRSVHEGTPPRSVQPIRDMPSKHT